MLKVGVLLVDLQLPNSHSLKEKRGPLKRLLNQLRKQFSCSCCECGDQNLHQRAKIGITLACSDAVTLDQIIRQIGEYIRFNADFVFLDMQTESLNYHGEN